VLSVGKFGLDVTHRLEKVLICLLACVCMYVLAYIRTYVYNSHVIVT
jgi:hypothetical protein